jgi:signal transduction histidine kinase
MLVLDVYLGTKKIHCDVPLRGKITVGRDPSNSLALLDASVSRRHASVTVEYVEGKPTLTVRDEGSTNGTYVNGTAVVATNVATTDTIFVGRCRLAIREGTVSLLPGVKDDDGQTIVFTGSPFDDSGQSSSRLEALHELAEGLHELDIPSILDKACAIVKRCLTFDSFCVVIEEDGHPDVKRSWNCNGPCEISDISVSQTIVETCLREKQPLISGNLRCDSRFRGVDSIAIKRLSSAMCAPLLSDDGGLGVLYCSLQSSRKTYENDDLQFLMLVASAVAIALRHERSLSQARLEARKREVVLQSLREAVLVCDDQFRVVSANTAASALFACESLTGRVLDEIFEKEGYTHDFEPVSTSVHKAFFLHRVSEGVASYKVDRQESYHATVSPVSGLENEGWRHIICMRDVTNVHRSEKMREVFAYQLAHKLNTPLTLVQSTATFLEEKIQALFERLGEKLDDESRELIATSEKNLAEMNRLIESFVQLSGTEIGKAGIEAHHEVVALSSLVNQALDFADAEIRDARIKVRNSVGDCVIYLVVNIEKVVECFLQIVYNAAKFIGEDATLSVDYWTEEDGVHVSFTDDGPGIPMEQQEDVFKIFHQIDVDDTGAVPGLGLGLWWTREVVQVHGGDVSLTSPVEEGRGTRIDIVFPTSILVDSKQDEILDSVHDAACAQESTTSFTPSAVDLEIS